jgi:DNA end-binding protein Ku
MPAPPRVALSAPPFAQSLAQRPPRELETTDPQVGVDVLSRDHGTADRLRNMRATWKGFLKISLVNVPILVFPATESSGSLSFNQLHGECQTRIQQKKWCAHCAREVPSSELVKGYEFEKGRYVVLSEEDFDKVHVDSTRVIDLKQFADETAIDPMYVDRTYYLAPGGAMAADAYAVLRAGLQGKIGIGKLALYGREYLVAVRVKGRGLVLHTLHHAAEIRSIEAIDELRSVPAAVRAEEVQLAKQVVEAFQTPLDLATYVDEYRAGLQTIIDAKIAGEEVTAPTIAAPPPVVNLVDALKRSLARIDTAKKRPVKVERPRPARKGRAVQKAG